LKYQNRKTIKRRSKKTKPRNRKVPSFVWGTPQCYTAFLNLCSDRFDNHGGNVFEDGNARQTVADELSKQYPGCTPEIIRQKLRSDVVIEDLARRHIHKKEKKEASQRGF